MQRFEVSIPLPDIFSPGLVICPSRELAVQTYEVLQGMTDNLAMSGYPNLKVSLMIGGQGISEQESKFRSGCHIAVATPVRVLLCEHDEERLMCATRRDG